MLEIIDEALQEMLEAATAKVAVCFGRHDCGAYQCQNNLVAWIGLGFRGPETCKDLEAK
jgi:hypothetical protein